jgi:F-type H+-transporting ATPase subunit gamma
MDPDQLLSSLIREYLFITLFRAFVDSMASENAARLAAMQGAQTNIEELMDDLQRQYHQLRQMSITEELLDIVSGFEALNQAR